MFAELHAMQLRTAESSIHYDRKCQEKLSSGAGASLKPSSVFVLCSSHCGTPCLSNMLISGSRSAVSSEYV